MDVTEEKTEEPLDDRGNLADVEETRGGANNPRKWKKRTGLSPFQRQECDGPRVSCDWSRVTSFHRDVGVIYCYRKAAFSYSGCLLHGDVQRLGGSCERPSLLLLLFVIMLLFIIVVALLFSG